MFSRKACYFFVRPHAKRLELCIFLGRALRSPLVKKVLPSSRAKMAHIVHIVHRDQVEPPITDWLREAYEVSPSLAALKPKRSGAGAPHTVRKAAKKKAAKKKA
jgi:hypothetical protein